GLGDQSGRPLLLDGEGRSEPFPEDGPRLPGQLHGELVCLVQLERQHPRLRSARTPCPEPSAMVCSCQSLPPAPPAQEGEPVIRRPLALVLSGGGAKGAYAVGAVEVLLERLPLPDLVCGSSVGALVAAMLAEGRSEERRVGEERGDQEAGDDYSAR